MRAIDADALELILSNAIEMMRTMAKALDSEDDPEIQMEIKAYTDILTGVKEQPTAQPEIIHCKDCKHHFVHRCMDSIPTEICDLNQTFYDAEVDFCSLAERRHE